MAGTRWCVCVYHCEMTGMSAMLCDLADVSFESACVCVCVCVCVRQCEGMCGNPGECVTPW